MSTILSKRLWGIILSIVILVLIGYFILPVSLPIITALFTAFLLVPIVSLLQDRAKIKRNLAVMIVFTIFVCFIGLSGYFITTKAVTQAIQLVENLPIYINEINLAWMKMQQKLDTTYADLPPELIYEINMQVNTTLNGLRQELGNRNIIGDITTIVTKIPSYLVTFIVYLIALFLFMLELPKLKKRFYAHLSEKTADKVSFMASRLSFVIFGFFKAQFLVSIIIFIVSLIGLLLITPEVALLMAFIIWLIDFIPIIGSIVILAPWALYYLIAGNLATGTQLLILAGILLIIRRTVEPKVMGKQIGLSPLATLIAMYIGLKLLGIIGLIAGPLLVIAFTSAREAGIIKLDYKI
ncbi:sporulation integral membrane protein YtvI [Anaerobacillus sp. MEB173]|uniref:sporulation integral membrane protein YtvI n=1 Tax=Anaerobacillus sp. MEB173 TaxID=3383345 RepID=UPI003F8DB28D